MKSYITSSWSWTPLFFAGLTAMLIFSSCAKNRNDIYIDLGDVNNESGKDSTAGKPNSQISFSASIESIAQTKSISPLSSNRYAMIWAYASNRPMSAGPSSRLLFKTDKPGTLTPVFNPMYLPNGNYNFYSIATNSSSNQNPNFNSESGVSSSALLNGVDYLWWGSPNVSIAASSVNIPIVYSHSCTQVVIKLVAGKGIVLNSQSAATITPANPSGLTMDLLNGVITPGTILQPGGVAMGVSNFVSQYTMLPLAISGNMTATFTIMINNESVSRLYTVGIPVPSGGLKAGKSYLYKAIVNANEIIFNSVDVIDWIEVDEQGTPLYPTQV